MDDDSLYTDELAAACPVCANEAGVLGTLGLRPYFQCIGCGSIFSLPPQAA